MTEIGYLSSRSGLEHWSSSCAAASSLQLHTKNRISKRIDLRYETAVKRTVFVLGDGSAIFALYFIVLRTVPTRDAIGRDLSC